MRYPFGHTKALARMRAIRNLIQTETPRSKNQTVATTYHSLTSHGFTACTPIQTKRGKKQLRYIIFHLIFYGATGAHWYHHMLTGNLGYAKSPMAEWMRTDIIVGSERPAEIWMDEKAEQMEAAWHIISAQSRTCGHCVALCHRLWQLS